MALVGCNAWLSSNGSRETSGGLQQNSEPTPAASKQIGTELEGAAHPIERAKAQPADQRFEELAEAEWVLAPASAGETDQLLNPFAEPKWPRRRWRHVGLEAVLSRADAAEQLRIAARLRDPTIATNAAIGLAQLG